MSRIIVAETEPEIADEKYLNLPDIEEEEQIEIESKAEKTVAEEHEPEKPEPLFTEIPDPEALKAELSRIDEETAAYVISSTELFKSCVLPNKTELQERNLKTKSDILVGDHCNIGYGLYGNDVVICELSTMYGDVVAEGDLRIDNFCEVHGTVICNGDAYLGEGVKIHGKLTVGGNLDIGDNVTIDKEFKALGDIAIRNPMPVVLYLLLYVMTMLHIEGEDSTKRKLNAMMAEVQTTPLVLPPKTSMDLRYFSVPTEMDIGANCRLHGNIKAETVRVKKDTTIFGSIQASRRAKVGPRAAVHGDVAAKNIRVEHGADILGDLLGSYVWLHEDARVSGVIKATEGLTIGRNE